MAAKYRFTTLGCKVNQYESQVIREVLEDAGLRPAREGEAAAWTVINTCAVTAEAVRKSRQAIRRAGRDGRSRVVVVGCAASAKPEQLREIPGVAGVFGHGADVSAEIRRLIVGSSAGGPCASEVAADRVSAGTRPTASNGSLSLDEGLMRPVSPSKPGTAAAARRDTSVPSSIDLPLGIVKQPATEAAQIQRFDGHQRAFLKIQDGCDAFCTYCIIPRLRPRLSSKPIAAAVAETRALVAAGHREIILTGIFMGAYGHATAIRKRQAPRVEGVRESGRRKGVRDSGSEGVREEGGASVAVAAGIRAALRPDVAGGGTTQRTDAGAAGDPTPLAELVDAIAQVEGLERLRLSSLEPGDVDDALLDVLSRHRNCVPHLHLPLQSGSEDVLRRMNRQYTVEAFVDMIDRVRTALDRPAISTDIIVGFPGETEADFEQTLAVARESEFLKIHAFPFSPREGTAAAKWQRSFVRPEASRERMNRLAALERELSLDFRRQFVGAVERVIVEPSKLEAAPEDTESLGAIIHGRCDRYFEIHTRCRATAAGVAEANGPPRAWDDRSQDLPALSPAPGEIIHVRIERVTPTRTHGRLVSPHAADLALPVLGAVVAV